MTHYLFSVWHAEGDPTPDDETMQQMYADVDAFNKEVTAKGVWIYGGGLEPPATAHVANEDGSVTEGTIATGPEQLGGFWVLDAPDESTALEWGRKAARAVQGRVEVRPFQAE